MGNIPISTIKLKKNKQAINFLKQFNEKLYFIAIFKTDHKIIF